MERKFVTHRSAFPSISVARPFPWGWLLFGIFSRLLASATALRFANPDEWFQTVEFANLMQFGFMSKVFEVTAHLRNLSWPFVLRLPLAVAQLLDPGGVFTRIFVVKCFVGAIDLAVTFFFLIRIFSTLTASAKAHTDSKWFFNLFYGSFLLPWFWFSHSVRPSIEHMSSLAAMLAIALSADPRQRKTSYFLAGICFVLVGALRYPSALFSLGALAALLFYQRQNFLRYVLPGTLLGLVLFGLADWYYFGRAWESVWMYLQFNLFTGLSSKYFGSQSVTTYLQFFWDTFGNELILWGFPLLFLGLLTATRKLGQGQAWAFGTVIYLLGHLLPSHKEGRFLIPVLPFITYGALQFVWDHQTSLLRYWKQQRSRIISLGIVTLSCNAVHTLQEWRGEWGKLRWDYLQVVHIASTEIPCAIVTEMPLVSSFLYWRTPERIPEIPTATADIPATMNLATESPALAWIDRPSSCQNNATAFIHLRRRNDFFIDAGCKERPLYQSRLAQQLHSLARGTVMYSCSVDVLSKFTATPQPWPLVRNLPHIKNLPIYGISAEDFMNQIGGHETLPPL